MTYRPQAYAVHQAPPGSVDCGTIRGHVRIDTLGLDQPLEVLVGIARLDPRGFRGDLGRDVLAAGPGRAALPVREVGIGASSAGAHGRAVHRLLESR